MRRVICLLCTTLAFTAIGRSASAGWHDFWNQFHQDYHRNVAWPDPFRHADREVQRAPFCIMVNNGWRLNNTLSHDLFELETHALNHAGWRKVRWILTQAPVHRRSIWVLQADTAEATQARMESVREAVEGMVGQGPLPPIMLTDREPLGVSGDYVDQIDRQFRSSMPVPTLPQMSGDASQFGP